MRLRKLFATGVLSLFLLAPAIASADTASDLQSRIDALLKQLAALQAQQAAAQVTGASVGSSVGASSATLSAAFVSANPRTATFTYTMNQGRSCNGGLYGIYFGDENLAGGQEPQLLSFPADVCNAYVQKTEHTYAASGRYTAQLYDLSGGGKKLLASIGVVVGESETEGGDGEDWGELTLTVNGSSEEVTLTDGERAKFKWDAREANVENCGLYYPGKNGNVLRTVRLSGTRSIALYPSKVSEPFISLSCDERDTGERVHAYVRIVSEKVVEDSGLVAEFVASSMDVNTDGGYAEFEIVVQLTALDSDVYVTSGTFTEDTTLSSVGAKTGWNYDLVGANASANGVTVYSNGDFETLNGVDYFLVEEGDTEEFTLSATGPSTATQLKLGAIQFGPSPAGAFEHTLYVSPDEFKTPAPRVTSGPLRVTAPNGGEQWELGTMNTITWTPYSYNPDVNPSSDVVAYLEKKSGSGFTTVGKIMPSGKASIHWETELNDYGEYPNAGEYYVRIENKKTRESDRSDRAFTLTPRSVDLKVNRSDGPVSLADGARVSLAWSAQGDIDHCYITSVRSSLSSDTYSVENLPARGTMTAYYREYGAGAISITCELSGKQISRYDRVAVTTVGTDASSTSEPALTVLSPNGGEQLTLGRSYEIKWNETGVPKHSIALYKNDAWYQWLVKDEASGAENISRGGVGSYEWTPSTSIPTGSGYKIYMTGKGADGMTYVDDKSDRAFSFVSASTATSTTSTTLGLYRGYMNGNLFITTPNISRADALANCKLNAANNSTKAVYCTWENEEIYRTNGTTTAAAPTCTVTASNDVIRAGETTKLTWTSKNATSVSGKGVGTDEVNGSMYVTPTSTATYTFTFTGAGGQKICSQQIVVESAVTAAPLTPTVLMSASPQSVIIGQGTTLKWRSTNANRCVLQYGSAEETVGTSDSRTFYPFEETTYRLICTNDPGTGKDGPTTETSVTVYITPGDFKLQYEQYLQASDSKKQQLASALAALLELLKAR